MKSAIKSLKNGRATGPDCIEAELFKCIQSGGLEVVAKALNKALEGQKQLQDLNEGVIIAIQKPGKPNVPANQRPISLLNIIRKIFAKVILVRCEKRLEEEIGENQTAYVSQRSTTDNVFVMKMIFAQQDICSEELQAFSVDISKAFDTIKRERLIQMIGEVFGPESDMARMIRLNLYVLYRQLV